MPKLKQSAMQERNNRVNACISRHSTLRMVDNRKMAQAAGISYETFCRRRKDPGTFTLDELKALSKYLYCSLMEICGEEVP